MKSFNEFNQVTESKLPAQLKTALKKSSDELESMGNYGADINTVIDNAGLTPQAKKRVLSAIKKYGLDAVEDELYSEASLNENQQVIDMVKKILSTAEFYDLQGKKRKGMTYDRLKQEMKYAGAKRIPASVVFQSALRQAGLNVKAIGGSDKKGGKVRSTVNYWTIIESLNEASSRIQDSDIDDALQDMEYDLEDFLTQLSIRYDETKNNNYKSALKTLKVAMKEIERARVYIDKANM